jgi:hypothetical protein
MTDVRLIERVLAEASRAKCRLSLEEVFEAGLPAVYQQYGDLLVYMDGRIFDASDPRAVTEVSPTVAGAAIKVVGVEFGWRHAGDCSCLFCVHRPADEAA